MSGRKALPLSAEATAVELAMQSSRIPIFASIWSKVQTPDGGQIIRRRLPRLGGSGGGGVGFGGRG